MFLTVAQIFKKGGYVDSAGTPNFLMDAQDWFTEAQWTDSQIGGLTTATFKLKKQYEDYADTVAGDWIVFGCYGGLLNAQTNAGATQIVVNNAQTDQGIDEFVVGDPIIVTDGTNSEIFVVSAVSYTGSEATITLGAAPSQNTTSLLNSYAAGALVNGLFTGTRVARLQFQGLLTGRQRTTALSNDFSLKAQGMAWRWQKVLTGYNLTAVDCATWIYELIYGFAPYVPEIIVTQSNFATANGINYTGSSSGSPHQLWALLKDMLQVESGGKVPSGSSEASVWSVWVDALREAHHAQLPTQDWASPTFTLDLIDGSSYGDVAGPLQPTDMDMSRLLNCLVVDGGLDSNGHQVRIIVTHKPSYTQWGYYEGYLSNPNIGGSDTADVESALALWAAGQLATLAWPQQTGKLQLLVDSLRMSARDLLKITGFSDGSTLITNPVAIQHTVSIQRQTATATISITQQQPNFASIIGEIGAQKAISATLGASPGTNVKGTYIVSGFDVSTNGLNYTIGAGVVVVDGQTYTVPETSGVMTSPGKIALGVQVAGTPPAGVTLPAIVPMPSFQAVSLLQGGQWFELQDNGGSDLDLVQQSSFTGLQIVRLTAANGEISAVASTAGGGIGNANLKPPTPATPTAVLQSLSLTPEGATQATAHIRFTIDNAVFDDTIGSVEISWSVAGLGQWHPPLVISWAPNISGVLGRTMSMPGGSTGVSAQLAYDESGGYDEPGGAYDQNVIEFEVDIHGLAAGQGYDLGVHIRGRSGATVTADPMLLGTSPTISASAIATALSNANLPAMPAGATISASGVTETVFEAGMHTLLASPIGYSPELELAFTLGEANTPPASQWGCQFIGYIRQTGTSTYARIPQPLIAASSITNGSTQKIKFSVTPGESYDVAVTLADQQGNETPQVALVTGYAVSKVQRGDPVGPIWGKPHMLPTSTDPTNGIWDNANGVLDHVNAMSAAVQAAIDHLGNLFTTAAIRQKLPNMAPSVTNATINWAWSGTGPYTVDIWFDNGAGGDAEIVYGDGYVLNLGHQIEGGTGAYHQTGISGGTIYYAVAYYQGGTLTLAVQTTQFTLSQLAGYIADGGIIAAASSGTAPMFTVGSGSSGGKVIGGGGPKVL